MTEPETIEPKQAGHIEDARGRTVSQLDPVAMHLLRRPGIIPPEALKGIAQQVGIGMTRATQVAFWSSLLGLACLTPRWSRAACRLSPVAARPALALSFAAPVEAGLERLLLGSRFALTATGAVWLFVTAVLWVAACWFSDRRA